MLWHDICLEIAALVLALVFVPLAMKLAYKIGAVDKPNARKVHTKIMPRMGGLGIYLAYIIVVLATQKMNMQLAGLLLGSTILVVLGIFDDMKDLNAKFKLLIQILAAVIVMAFGVRIEFMTNVFGGGAIYLDILSLPITLLWIVGITNAINLIDGLDGLAGGIATIAALSMAVVGWIYGQYLMASMAIILAGATMGFLRYNFHPAKVFMGDTGSLFLGFNLSVLAIMGVAKSVTFISLAAPVLVLGVPIFDTFFAILRRKMNHKPIFAADKDHLHHRLLAWIKYADERLQFTRGLSSDDEPELWLLNDHLGVDLWIELGLPDERRIKKACSRAQAVALFAYNSRAAEIWWQQNQSKLAAYPKLTIWYLDDAQLALLSAFADRTMTLQATLQEGSIWLSDARNNLEIQLTAWQASA